MKADNSSYSILRTPDKCILCGKCVRMCNEIQNVGAIDYAYRGSKMKIATAFDGDNYRYIYPLVSESQKEVSIKIKWNNNCERCCRCFL